MKIVGENICLEPVREEQLETFAEWTHDPEVVEFMWSEGLSLEDERRWFKRIVADPDEYVFAVWMKSGGDDASRGGGRLIGNCAVHDRNYDKFPGDDERTMLGIFLGDKSQWGKGYGVEVLELLMGFVKDQLKRDEAYLSVSVLHERAIRCYRKCGFEIVETRVNPKRKMANQQEYLMRVGL